jgi:hypothetical protein
MPIVIRSLAAGFPWPPSAVEVNMYGALPTASIAARPEPKNQRRLVGCPTVMVGCPKGFV